MKGERKTYRISEESRLLESIKSKKCIVHRVIATENNNLVAPGTVGGWLESEKNLYDGAWVADEAIVIDNARVASGAIIKGNAFISRNAKIASGAIVKDNARVTDSALVFGSCIISDHASISGNARVVGNCIICDHATLERDAIIQGTKDNQVIIGNGIVIHGGCWNKTPFQKRHIGFWTVNISSPDSLRIGCQDYTFEYWREHWREVLITIALAEHKELLNYDAVYSIIQNYICVFNEACDSCAKSELKVNFTEDEIEKIIESAIIEATPLKPIYARGQ